jgi:hypothetical protein
MRILGEERCHLLARIVHFAQFEHGLDNDLFEFVDIVHERPSCDDQWHLSIQLTFSARGT